MVVKVSLLSGAVASDGVLSIQTNGTTEAISISTGQVATFANNPILTGGTINGVAYLNGSKILTTGSALVFDASGNLGVGTPSPTARIDVQNNQNATSNFYFRNTDTTNTSSRAQLFVVAGGQTISLLAINSDNVFLQRTSGSLQFQNAGSTQMLLDSAGNLGLGVTPSAWFSGYKALQVGTSNPAGFWSGGYDVVVGSNIFQDGSGTYKQIGASYRGAIYKQFDSAHSWYTTTNVGANTSVTPTQAMTLDASGNLGVGTTSPNLGGLTRALTLNTPTGGNYSGVELAGAGTISARFITNNAAGTYFGSQVSIPLVFETNATERARIDSSGNLGINTTGINSGRVAILFAGATQNAIETQDSGTNSGAGFFSCRNSGGTQIGSITRVGTTNNVIFNTASDYRLKNVIGAVTGAGERIDALEPIEYTWKEDGSQSRGFLAHKFKEIYSQSVSGEKDAIDAEGNPIYQAMQASTSEVIADLVAEIQSLRQRLAALEAK
jgi:hypothetical protein